MEALYPKHEMIGVIVLEPRAPFHLIQFGPRMTVGIEFGVN